MQMQENLHFISNHSRLRQRRKANFRHHPPTDARPLAQSITAPVPPAGPPPLLPPPALKLPLAQLAIDLVVRLAHPPPEPLAPLHPRLVAPAPHPPLKVLGARPARVQPRKQRQELPHLRLLGRGRGGRVRGRERVQERPGGAAERFHVRGAVRGRWCWGVGAGGGGGGGGGGGLGRLAVRGGGGVFLGHGEPGGDGGAGATALELVAWLAFGRHFLLGDGWVSKVREVVSRFAIFAQHYALGDGFLFRRCCVFGLCRRLLLGRLLNIAEEFIHGSNSGTMKRE